MIMQKNYTEKQCASNTLLLIAYLHCTELSLLHYVSAINHVNKQFAITPNSKIDLFMGDIKQMYTELRHDVIMKALDWALKTFHHS